ncbi:MAG: aminopeptidase N [Nocardioidaceae bacterium]|nr:aminopeptidase N [Nocardioidaceae bacterium]
MPGQNLTRDEARERADLLSVDAYCVELDLTSSDSYFSSTTTVQFGCRVPGATVFADLVDATINEISLNGAALDPGTCYEDSRITLDDLARDNELRVVAQLPFSRVGEGLHRFVDPVDKRVYLYSQFEVPDARRMYTTFEQPDLKASFELHVTAPSGWQVVSNAATPDPVELAGAGRPGLSVWRFAPTGRLSTYVTALVAGEYHEVRDRYVGDNGEIPLGVYCRQSIAAHLDADDILEITKQGFAFFESTFAMAYPFGKYDQLFVPEYNMGAMENAGCVTLRDEYVFRSRQTVAAYEGRANTILHEMAHMWFGDLVTMRWWDDLWLNESFAEWAAHHSSEQATRYTDAWTGFTNGRKNWAYKQDQQPSTHPIAADNADLEAVEVNFDGITYAKGASALRQLVAWVGEPEFLAGLREYFRRHAWGNTDLVDLLHALEETSGRDLGAWAKEWLQTAGVNTMRPALTVDAHGRYSSAAIEQTALTAFPTLRRHRVAVGLYWWDGGRLVRRRRIELDVEGETTEVPELVGQPRPDLLLLNDGDLTYTKIRLDAHSLATAIDGIAALDDSLARALVWGAAWDMTRDCELRTRDYVSLVLSGLRTETDLTAVATQCAQALHAVTTYSDPAGRDALAERWEAGLHDLLARAEPRSDRQLAFARAYASSAHTGGAFAVVASLVDGSRPIAGLEVDTDLRWTFVTALARGGRADVERIASELERDSTISGQEHAAAARTVRPLAAAKEDAWRDVVVREDVPNETQRKIAWGFQVPGQQELLAPYVERYLDVAASVWETKGTYRAGLILTWMFPAVLVSETTRDRVAAWLASTDANPAARRLVGEGLADLERALRAQARDATPDR